MDQSIVTLMEILQKDMTLLVKTSGDQRTTSTPQVRIKVTQKNHIILIGELTEKRISDVKSHLEHISTT